ncbi:MAG: B12-binding domain-containing radical SAM protein [Planctomycetota bacterium]|jgi:radical SAM superfamily enzyme YgiQ (UPF0313 family)
MKPKVLLIHPPIYDFTAYDFWLKPYGLLRAAGMLRDRASLHLFDFLDRQDPRMPKVSHGKPDPWGRGPFHAEITNKPPVLSSVPRRFRRFGIPREALLRTLAEEGPFPFAWIQTGMTYWYPGVQEVIDLLRTASPSTKIVLGGGYATLCEPHARALGADVVVRGDRLEPLWDSMGLEPDPDALPYWEGYSHLKTGILRLTDGCPIRCTYCAVREISPSFRSRPLQSVLAELDLLIRLGARDIAFYDDALLHQAERILLPFLEALPSRDGAIRFHSPNALHARSVTPALAERMVEGGFQTFYLGFESGSETWQERTGGKVNRDAIARAVEALRGAGASPGGITAYLLLGHPLHKQQELEASMRFIHTLGVRIMLADYSPLPGTPDGERCRASVDLDEPLWHNKTAFPYILLGVEEVNRLKKLCRQFNHALKG